MIRTYLDLLLRSSVTTILILSIIGVYIDWAGSRWFFDEDVDIFKGYFLLLDEKFSQSDMDYEAFSEHYTQHLGFPVELVSQQEIDDIDLIANMRGVTIDIDKELYYWPLSRQTNDPNYQWLLIDPYANTSDTGALLLIAELILVCALSMFLWVLPLMRRLARLKKVADEFGQGKLDARIKDNKRDEINRIMMSFNDMAAQLGSMIDRQRTANQAFSHEIRTPLSRIKMLVHNLQADKKQAVLEEVDEIDFLISEILAYSNVQSVHEKDQMHWFDMQQWISDSFSDWVVPEEIAYQLQIDNSVGQQQVWGSESQLELLISNLLLNAMRYAESRVRLSISRRQTQWHIQVEDDGPGVPEAVQQKVFEPFFRADSSRSRETGGSGMGLAIASKIASYHNATLHCSTSDTLGGACFTLTINT